MTAAAQARVLGANDRIRVGIIGPGGRGRYLMGEFKEFGADLAAVCDVYTAESGSRPEDCQSRAESYKDYRKLLDNKSLDAVIVSTPDHWHAKMVIDAVNAGKDVYVEKPMAHKIEEGFAVIDAVRKTKRVVQVGTQRRSAELFLEGKSIMDSGQLGEVHLVTSQWLNHTANLRKSKLQGELDWNMWQGSAPKHELDPQRYFNWYYYYDYSGGLIVGSGGAHYRLHSVVHELERAACGDMFRPEARPSGSRHNEYGDDSGRVPGELSGDIYAGIQVDDVQQRPTISCSSSMGLRRGSTSAGSHIPCGRSLWPST